MFQLKEGTAVIAQIEGYIADFVARIEKRDAPIFERIRELVPVTLIPAHNAWLRLRYADDDGRGRVSVTAPSTGSGQVVSPTVLTAGEGIFWQSAPKQGMVYLRSPKRVVQALEEQNRV